ncbi:MAG: oligosaccharide flippase family protein [Actinobacteria bacterium]|nr:oligosaccharide flippase family protein [Actinomycetota bacterium]
MFESILKSATFKQSQITVVGTILNGILGALFYIYIARILGPADFGLITVSIAMLTMIADNFCNSTNTGLVRHVSANQADEKETALRFLKLGLKFKFIVWILVLIVGFFLSPFVAQNIFNKGELILPLRLVMVGVGGALFFSFATSALQSFQKYFTWSIINILTNFLRLLFIFILFFGGNLNILTGLVSYIAMPFVGFSIALLFLPISKILTVKNESSVARQFFHYNFWVALFTVIAAVSARLDTFLSARLLTISAIGLYGAATQLVQVIPQIVGALGVVAAPKFASFQDNKQMLTYLKKLQLLVLGLALLGVLTIPLLIYLIPIIFGQQYTQAVTPFVILFLGMLVFLISLPVHTSIIYYFSKPNVFVWVSICHLLIIGLLGYFLISNFGVIGAATTVLVGMIFNFLAPLAWFIYKLKVGKHV